MLVPAIGSGDLEHVGACGRENDAFGNGCCALKFHCAGVR